MPTAFVGFGGNLGDVARTFDSALAGLLADGCSRFLVSSSLYRSRPWGGVEQPDYLNAVVQIETLHSAHALLNRLLAVEAAHGRNRAQEVRWGARTLDLDLLLYGTQHIETPDLEVPHPRLLERGFVVLPLLEIAPDLQWMDGTPLRERIRTDASAIMEVLDRRIQPEPHNETDPTT